MPDDLDCDCDCDGCDCNCDCKCDDCDCNCLDCFGNCCSGETNVIFCCCFPRSSNDTITTHHRTRDTSTDCSLFSCCFYPKRNTPMRASAKSSTKRKRGKFCPRLWSCFRREPSPPPSPTGDQPKSKIVLPNRGCRQDGRFDGRNGMMPPKGYRDNGRYIPSEGRLDYFPKGYKQYD